MIRTYSELISLPTFTERFRYLSLRGMVAAETFGFDRYLNQKFYRSSEWKALRDRIICRDMGRDLAAEGFDIHGSIIIHHMNPIFTRDIIHQTELLLNPEYLICTTHNTHNAIHYGDESLLITGPAIRTKNDTCPWKH